MKKSRDIERFLKSDMYSFALVMWEVLRKTRTCDSASEVEEFALPYHTDVDSDPSFEAMKKVVCLNETRPYIPDRWHQNHVIVFTFLLRQWKKKKLTTCLQTYYNTIFNHFSWSKRRVSTWLCVGMPTLLPDIRVPDF